MENNYKYTNRKVDHCHILPISSLVSLTWSFPRWKCFVFKCSRALLKNNIVLHALIFCLSQLVFSAFWFSFQLLHCMVANRKFVFILYCTEFASTEIRSLKRFNWRIETLTIIEFGFCTIWKNDEGKSCRYQPKKKLKSWKFILKFILIILKKFLMSSLKNNLAIHVKVFGRCFRLIFPVFFLYFLSKNWRKENAMLLLLVLIHITMASASQYDSPRHGDMAQTRQKIFHIDSLT